MSGPHLVKKGREHRKMDLHRDFTVASPAEFVTRFGGNRVIEKVRGEKKTTFRSFYRHWFDGVFLNFVER